MSASTLRSLVAGIALLVALAVLATPAAGATAAPAADDCLVKPGDGGPPELPIPEPERPFDGGSPVFVMPGDNVTVTFPDGSVSVMPGDNVSIQGDMGLAAK